MSTEINLINKIVVLDEGTIITSDATSLNFTGPGVIASSVDGDVTISITGGGGGGGISFLNGLSATTQTFAIGTSGTDFGISSIGSTHTFDLPTASAINRGLLSSADWTTFNSKGTVSSVGLSMPSAFTVASSPVTGSGTIAVTGAGTVSQYVRGDGTLANFPNSTGGGSSVSYYLNGSVSQGTFGGDTYYQMSKTPILGAGTNFIRTNGSGNGYIASFITDAGDPSFLNIPGGNWNLEFYFQSSAPGGTPRFYGEIYKVSATNVFTLVASGSVNPESITNGTAVDQYFTSVSVPQTSLLITDRLAIRIYVITGGRTITLHTENGNLCEVVTTFTTGLTALNGLTSQVQYFATGTSGADFNISSATDIHTFNLPTASNTNRGLLSTADWITFNSKGNGTVTSVAALTLGTTGTDVSSTVATGTTTPVITLNIPTASATNRGALSSANWTTFNNKIGGSGTTNYVSKFTASGTIGNSLIQDNGTTTSINTALFSGSTLIISSTAQTNTLDIRNTKSNGGVGISVSVEGTATSSYNYGIQTNAFGSDIANYGGSFAATGTSLNVAGVFSAIDGATNYSLKLVDGTEVVAGRFLKNMTTDGYANWATLTVADTGLTLTTTGSSGSASLVSNTLNIPTYTLAGLGGITLSSLSANTPLSYNTGTGAFSIQVATTAQNGYLSFADWNTFSGKVSGSGTANYVSKFTASGTIANSIIRDDGTTAAIGAAPTVNSMFSVTGNAGALFGISGRSIKANGYGGDFLGVNGVKGTGAGSGGAGSATGGEFYAYDNALNIGVYGLAGIDSYGATTNIGGKFIAIDATNNYSLQLIDGTEGLGKFLKCVDGSSGYANWATMSVADTGLAITTTGTSGAATLVGNTLNIPQYTGGTGSFDYGLSYAMASQNILL